jgi:hypothetical protein
MGETIRKILRSKTLRYLLPFLLAAVFGYGSIRIYGDSYAMFLAYICIGFFAGLLIGA